jgi:aryl-phospho-beta-D-glucosidase BglC (GH1 family)
VRTRLLRFTRSDGGFHGTELDLGSFDKQDKIIRKLNMKHISLFLIQLCLSLCEIGTLPVHPAIPERLRGFNLLGKFDVTWSNTGFIEEDFILIKELGFNFIRVPIDYRTYTGPGNWLAFNEEWEVPQGVYRLSDDVSFGIGKIPAGFEKFFQGQNATGKWKELEAQGVQVFIGEWGVYQFTPHKVALAFMEDQLKKMKAAGFGWALWNFRGSFGILGSQRANVQYEDFHGHKLDRKMLELFRANAFKLK